MIQSPKRVELNSSTFTAVSFGAMSMQRQSGFFPISAYTDDNTEWEIATDLSGTDAVPVFANQVYNNSKIIVDETGVIFYARASAGTPDLVLHIGRPQRC